MWSIILLMLSGFFNSIMDVIRYRWNKSIFNGINDKWMNPSISWKNKWKNGDINQGEKFFGSSTFLVFLTDFWHFAKSLMILFYVLSVVMYKPIFNWYIDSIILYLSFTITFEIFFSKILIKNK